MRTFLILAAVVLCISSCSKYSDVLSGKDFDGGYHPIERLYLQFDHDSVVVGHISSTDFVGHFSDNVYGHYEYEHPYITIVWERTDPKNDKYHSFPGSGCAIVNESLDTLRYFEGEQSYLLHKSRTFQPADKNAPLIERIGTICYQLLVLSIVFVLKYFFYIVALIIISVFINRWIKKRKLR